jgi:hypothetical protein
MDIMTKGHWNCHLLQIEAQPLFFQHVFLEPPKCFHKNRGVALQDGVRFECCRLIECQRSVA